MIMILAKERELEGTDTHGNYLVLLARNSLDRLARVVDTTRRKEEGGKSQSGAMRVVLVVGAKDLEIGQSS